MFFLVAFRLEASGTFSSSLGSSKLVSLPSRFFDLFLLEFPSVVNIKLLNLINYKINVKVITHKQGEHKL